MIYFYTAKPTMFWEGITVVTKPDIPLQILENIPTIYEDTETKGLRSFIPNQVLLIQLGNSEDQIVIDVNSGVDITPFKAILEDPNRRKVCHNAIFEINMLKNAGIEVQGLEDLMIKAKLVERGGKNYFNLAALFQRYLGKYLNKAEQTSFISSSGKYTQSQIVYAANDVCLDELDEKLSSLVEQNGLRNAELFENEFTQVLAEMHYNGLFLNQDLWNELELSNKKEMDKLKTQLDEWLIKNHEWLVKNKRVLQMDLFNSSPRKLNINYESPKQVKEILLGILGYLPLSKKGDEASDIKTLEKIVHESEFLKIFIEYKKLGKRISTYGKKFLENVDEDTRRIHCSYDQILATGRISSFNPNLQNIPALESYRNCFTPQHKNWSMVGADYSGMESQVMADKSGDEAFIDFFKNGDGDSHSMVSSKVLSAKYKREIIIKSKYTKIKLKQRETIEDLIYEKYSEMLAGYNAKEILVEGLDKYALFTYKSNPQRQKGKTLNFFISFGGSDYTLHKELGISLEEAKDLIGSFWKAFPQLKEYFDGVKAFALINGYTLISRLGGKRFYPEHSQYLALLKQTEELKEKYIERYGKSSGLSKYYSSCSKGGENYHANRELMIIKGAIEREAMNTGIQGEAAEITKSAAITFSRWIKDSGLRDYIKLVNVVHDEVLLEVHNDYRELAATNLKQHMEAASAKYLKHLVIAAAPYIHTSWKK